MEFSAPEIIDKKIINCRRVWNEKIKCFDYVEKNDKIAFRTCPDLEKGKLVFQMGTADPILAVQAAKMVVNDVSAIDVNSGCPKHFSIHSGMGAALLRTPDKLVNILTSLVTQVGEPFSIPISVKIRLLETEQKTIELVKRLVTTGIKCLTIHCRTTPMRPREVVIRDSLKKVADTCHEAGVMCLVNGDIEGYCDLDYVIEKYGVDGAMIARAAEANASCFNPDGPVPWYEIVKEFYEYCEKFDNHVVNTKFCLARMIPGKSPLYQKVAQSRTMDQIKQALDELTEEEKKKYPHVFKSPLTMLKEQEKEMEKMKLKKRQREEVPEESTNNKRIHLEAEAVAS